MNDSNFEDYEVLEELDHYDDFNYTAFRVNSELHKVDDEVIFILTIGASVAAVGLLAVSIQLLCQRPIKNHLFCYFNYQHTLTSLLQLVVLTRIYAFLRDTDLLDDKSGNALAIAVLYQVCTYCSLLIHFWTACISLKMYSDLFLFENGADVYTVKEVTKFAYISAAVIEFYEELVVFGLYFYINMYGKGTDLPLKSPDHENLHMNVPAVRFTSNLLLVSIATTMLFVIVLSCARRGDNRRFLGAVYLMQLLILLSGDLVLLVFRVRTSKDLDMFVSAVLLSARMIFEVFWTFLIKSNLPLLKNFNYY